MEQLVRHDQRHRVMAILGVIAAMAIFGNLAWGAGPLRVSSHNSRWFTDNSGNAVYFACSHTWSALVDNGATDPPVVFDYPDFLDWLQKQGHNCTKLWTFEEARYSTEVVSDDYWFAPMIYARTGPGNALDGKPKFDVKTFNQSYFDRLRDRVLKAQERGIYVIVPSFNGWSIGSPKGDAGLNNPWKGHPYNQANNINGVDGDVNGDGSGQEIHTLANATVTHLQEDYVRKVIEAIGEFDNVLWEVSIESFNDSTPWQAHIMKVIREYESARGKRHPVGMTTQNPKGTNQAVLESSADWISVLGENEVPGHYYRQDPPCCKTRKVVISDTDHLWGIGGTREWVWKTFTRGLYPIFMDCYDPRQGGLGVGGATAACSNPEFASLRANLGYTVRYAQMMNLIEMSPRDSLSSTGYCLSRNRSTNAEYLVYQPKGGEPFSLDLRATSPQSILRVEWFDPLTGRTIRGSSLPGGETYTFVPPFKENDAVLYVTNRSVSRSPAGSR